MEEKPIRLWLASPHFYPTYGGAQNRYRSYIPGFRKRGLDVQIVAGTPKSQDQTETDIDADWYGNKPGIWLPPTTLDGVKLERVRLPDHDNSARTQCFYNGLLDICQRPGAGPLVLQVLTNLRPEARPWLRHLKAQGVTILYSMSQFPHWPKKRFKRLHRRFSYRRVYNEFDAIVTNSQPIESLLREMGVTTRVQYIPNGVNLQRFHPARNENDREKVIDLRVRLGIPLDHKVIATVGAVMPRKGQDKLVKAWRSLLSRHPQTHLLVVGPRSDLHNPKLAEFGQEMAQQVEQSGAPSQVHFTGAVENVQDWLRASDIFVLASNREGTPNSVLEAMATGLPCVVTPYTGISDGIGVAGTHYQLVERKSRAIAQAVSALLENEEYRLELGKSGRRFVTENLDLANSLDSYTQLYTELCKKEQKSVAAGEYVWR